MNANVEEYYRWLRSGNPKQLPLEATPGLLRDLDKRLTKLEALLTAAEPPRYSSFINASKDSTLRIRLGTNPRTLEVPPGEEVVVVGNRVLIAYAEMVPRQRGLMRFGR